MRFEQHLERTYFTKGFFNVKVDHDRFIRRTEGHIAIQLGVGGKVLAGKVDRKANLNGTARIYGRSALRDWFQANFSERDIVNVEIVGPEHIVLSRPSAP